MNVEKLKAHKKNVEQLMSEADALDINCSHLIGHLSSIETAIKQATCNHDLFGEPFKTHGAEGIIWKCKKCNKIIDVETND